MNQPAPVLCHNITCRKQFVPSSTLPRPVENPAAFIQGTFYCSHECEREQLDRTSKALGRRIERQG